MKLKPLILACLCYLSSKGLAAESHLTLHTASYAGVLAGGGGWTGSLFDYAHYNFENILGLTPAFVGGENIYSLSNRLTIAPPPISLTPDKKWNALYFGFQLLSVFDRDTFFVSKKYPRGSVPATAIHWALLAGTELQMRPFKFYADISVLDLYLDYYRRNSRQIDLKEIISLGFGIRYGIAQ